MTNKPYIHRPSRMPAPVDGARLRRPGRRRYDDDYGEKPKIVWLITFTDTIALMLTFFVMMFAMSVPEKEEMSAVIASLGNELKPFHGRQQQSGPEEAPDTGRIYYQGALDLSYLDALMRAVVEREAGLKDIVTITPRDYGLVLSLPPGMLFAPGQDVLLEDATRPLFMLGGALSRVKNRVELRGRADAAGPDAGVSHWEMGLMRAMAVAAAFDRAGYTDPLVIRGDSGQFPQNPDAGRDENMRLGLSSQVDIVIMNQDSRAEPRFAR